MSLPISVLASYYHAISKMSIQLIQIGDSDSEDDLGEQNMNNPRHVCLVIILSISFINFIFVCNIYCRHSEQQ